MATTPKSEEERLKELYRTNRPEREKSKVLVRGYKPKRSKYCLNLAKKSLGIIVLLVTVNYHLRKQGISTDIG